MNANKIDVTVKNQFLLKTNDVMRTVRRKLIGFKLDN